MIQFRINGMPFTYKRLAPEIVSLQEFMLDARDLAFHYRKTIDMMSRTEQLDPTLVICDAQLLIDPDVKGEG